MTAPQQSNALLFWLGLLLVMMAAGASLVLALDHFDLSRAPGCGPESGCAKATRGPWGKVPGTGWPVSLAGLAYFTAATAAWVRARGRVSSTLRWIARLGAAISIMFIFVMVGGGYLCKYCVAAHVGNFGFVIVMEFAAARGRMWPNTPRAGQIAVAAVAFVLATGVLAVMDWRTAETRRARSDAELTRTTREVIDRTASLANATQPASTQSDKPFTGRWRLGPENAPIRIVIFSDYQCPDCKLIEHEAMALLGGRADVSLSAKHFPMSSICNPHMRGHNMHPNACWAARAAETAGALHGNEGFWKMHRWLFSVEGRFITREDLEVGLRHCGFEVEPFLQQLQSQESLEPVLADIHEGADLGLYFTPMVFINGVELRGIIGNPQALTRAVNALAATNPPPGSPHLDRPPPALQKILDDWRLQPPLAAALDMRSHPMGPDDAVAKIIVFGDYEFTQTANLDREIRKLIDGRNNVQYVLRHYPYNQACNPHVQTTGSQQGCWAAAAVEAAAVIGGKNAAWAIHDWLLANQGRFTDDNLRAAAGSAGLDADRLIATMKLPEVQRAVAADVAAGRSMISQGAIPAIFINGRQVVRWQYQGQNLLPQFIDEATRGKR